LQRGQGVRNNIAFGFHNDPPSNVLIPSTKPSVSTFACTVNQESLNLAGETCRSATQVLSMSKFAPNAIPHMAGNALTLSISRGAALGKIGDLRVCGEVQERASGSPTFILTGFDATSRSRRSKRNFTTADGSRPAISIASGIRIQLRPHSSGITLS